MTTELVELSHFGLIRISGVDAVKFLQGQLTSDVSIINAKQSGFTAYCNVKGRVVAVMRLFFFEEAYFLCLPQDLLSKTLTLLNKYKLAAKVILEDVTEKFTIFAALGKLDFINVKLASNENDTIDNNFIAKINENIYLVITKKDNSDFLKSLKQHSQIQPINTWQHALIENEIPFISAATSEMFTPEMLNLIELNAVSFTKGCYLGQEIVARAHHLGKTKRSLIKAKLQAKNQPEIAAKLVNSHNEELGNIILLAEENVNHYSMLAVFTSAALQEKIFLQTNNGPVIEII